MITATSAGGFDPLVPTPGGEAEIYQRLRSHLATLGLTAAG